MPTYEYACIKCDKTITKSDVKIDDRDKQCCEECGDVLKRSWTIGSMSVWSPTRNGGMSQWQRKRKS